MKHVTLETVRERLTHLEGLNARGVGTAVPQQQFELACLHELLARLESRSLTLPKIRSATEYLFPVAVYSADEMKSALALAGIQALEGEGQ